ncbi:transposase [Chryseomicrobium palamuruense]|uniref:Transposase n=1 Tax=Chryseomicrobium palamuruense TaxID=682973 RepID=A0ABV8UXV5_9BACL
MTKPRVLLKDNFYHVTIHGHNELAIFANYENKAAFLRILSKVHLKYKFTLLAYCIMSNHYHLLIKSVEVPLSMVVGSINLRYSLWYKRRHGHKGTLYDARFFAETRNSAQSLITTSVYIHCNPVHTLTPIVLSAELYEFSSYKYYFYELTTPPYLNTALLYSHLPFSFTSDKLNYQNLISTARRNPNKKSRKK